MTRCPFLEYESTGEFYIQGKFFCEISEKKLNDAEVSQRCRGESGEEYKRCYLFCNEIDKNG